MVPARIYELRIGARTTIASLVVVIVSDLGRLLAIHLPSETPFAWLTLGSFWVFGVSLFATIGTFLWWLRVAIRNLVNWGDRPRWGPGWATWSWFIPVADLVLPLLVVREAARRSGSGRGGTVLVVVWWVVFLAGEGLGDFSTLDAALTVPVYVAAAVLAIAVIAHITGLQVRRQSEFDAVAPVPGGLVDA